MSTATLTPQTDLSTNGHSDVPTLPIWRLTVDQYHSMIESGVLTDDDPVELLEGWLVQKMPKNKPHKFATRKLRRLLDSMLPAGWFADAQESVTTSDSEPEPDVTALRGEPEDYQSKDSLPADTGLLVEVSDSTLTRDRGTKKRIYARAGFAVYWIVNIPERQIEVYTQPSGPCEKPDYAQVMVYKEGDHVPVVIDGREVGRITVKDVLP